MARMARVVLPGVAHHVTQRGNRQQTTFFNEDDYRTYIALLAESAKRAGTEVWAWCLMPNHVHLILVPSHDDGLRATLGETHRRYTRRVNERERWQGHLWQSRFHSVPMDESYLLAAVRYLERNPVAVGLAAKPQDWRWSSAAAHLSGQPDGLTQIDSPLQGMVQDWEAFWRDDEDPKRLDAFRRHARTGRPLGDEGFLERAEKIVGHSLRRARPGPKARATLAQGISRRSD